MTKKLLYIALGAMFVFGILFLLWSWLFSGGKTAQTNGSFGTSTDSTQNLYGTGDSNNGQNNLGQNSSSGSVTVGNNGQNTSAGGTNVGVNGSSIGGAKGTVFTNVSPSVTGAQWLSGSTGSGLSSNTNSNGYNATAINGVDGATIGGTVPTIGSTVGGGGSGTGLTTALLGAGISGGIVCGLRSAYTSGAISAGTATALGLNTTGIIRVPVYDPSSAITAGSAVTQASLQTGDEGTGFAACILNVLAKAALQQITASVVNWINSGFKGNPSFITNYQQFFTNVADLAAGQFIQGTGLAFLCSPFKLQIKIAVAQSYANRNNAQSCTLSKVINNVNGFMNGNFSQGGWPGLLSVTTMPTNNPYGAYAYAQIGLVSAQNSALSNATRNISPTGFLNMQQQSCSGVTTYNTLPTAGLNSQAAQLSCPSNCSCKTTTPGSVIEGTLLKSLGSGVDRLGLASSLDQIISALTTQLITKALQGGLSNLSGTTGVQNTYQSPDQVAAQNQAQATLSTLQLQVVYAQQYGAIQQGSIADIQTTQRTVNNLVSCWGTFASSTSLTTDQAAQATTNFAQAQATFTTLQQQIDALNNNITQVNAEIATITQLQSEALSVASTADVQKLVSDYNAAQASSPFIEAADVTTAQQNRTTLQTQLSSTNTATQTSLQQCQAFGSSSQ